MFLSHILTALFPDRKPWPGLPDAVVPLIEAPGGIAVLYFFALSGFLLTWNWKPERSMATYALIRVIRIWPLHVTMWVAWIVLSVGLWDRPLDPLPIAVANLFLLHGWVLSTEWQLSMNGPTWTLSSEVFMYTVLPLLIVAGQVRVKRALFAGAVSLSVVFAAFLGLGPVENLLVWPPAALLPLVIGVLVAHAMQTRRDLDWTGKEATRALIVAIVLAIAMVVIVGLAGGLVGIGVPAVTTFWLLAMVIGGLTMARLVQKDLSGRRTAMRSKVLLVLGEYSFAIYLTHIPAIFTVLYAIDGMPDTTGGAVLASLAATALTTVMSIALYRLVERPSYVYLLARTRRAGAPSLERDRPPLRRPASR